MSEIGFVGLGAMGFGMATHLVKSGHKVYGYDVFPASVERFAAAGGIPAASLRESAKGKAAYICMVASAPQAESALFGEDGVVQCMYCGTDTALHGVADINSSVGIANWVLDLPPNATLILCSTVPASYAQSVADKLVAHNRSDILFVDSPVSGGTFRAAGGTLSLMAGGSEKALGSARDILQTLSDKDKLYLVAGGVGAGSNMKMLHQVLASIHILAASEVMGFAAGLGLEARDTAAKLLDKKSGTWTWMLENRFPRMVDEDWNPGASALTIILKDAGIITTSARQTSFPTPLGSTAEQIYLAALSQGYGPKDDSAMVRQYYSQPIANVSSPESAEASETALELVRELTRGIILVSAAESISFARHLNVDFDQFYDLVTNAAGGSSLFNERARELYSGVGAPDGRSLDEAIDKLKPVVQKARDLNIPLHLGNAALNVLLTARRRGEGAATSGVMQAFS